MGLISRFGLEKANELKKANNRTYQDLLFQMLGLEFTRQEYVFPFKNKRPKIPIRLGIESRAGDRWPMKKWPGYEQLYNSLSSLDVEFTFFNQRPMLEAYINDVNDCDILLTGDTLCMHLGLALKKRVIALFGPTSADEIFDYGRLTKIVSPAPCVKCYRRECSEKPNCMDRITLDMVLDGVNDHYENLLARIDDVPKAIDSKWEKKYLTTRGRLNE
jgi:heptosyltransferase-2